MGDAKLSNAPSLGMDSWPSFFFFFFFLRGGGGLFSLKLFFLTCLFCLYMFDVCLMFLA